MMIVAAYLMLQLGRLDPESVLFSAVNTIGAAAILYSLFFSFNVSAFIIEVFWLAISLFGWIRALRKQRAAAKG